MTGTPNQRPLLVHGGRVFTADHDSPWAEAVVVAGGEIRFVGRATDAADVAGSGAARIDVDGGLVLPGFVDGHVHVELTGESLGQAQLRDVNDLAGIQRRLVGWLDEHPGAPRVPGTGWVHGSVPNGTPTKEMIDEVVPDVPVYLHAYDYHSCWVNTAALRELGIGADTPDPPRGAIVRDPATGEATGWLLEAAAAQYVWPMLGGAGPDERDRHRRLALAAYARNGITTAVDMGMDEEGLDGLLRLDERGELTARIVAHMRIKRTGDVATELEQVARSAELARLHAGDHVRVAGIKIVADGTIDACTAAMLEPYANGTNADPFWDAESLNAAVAAADAAGLQIAIHAIGDRTIRLAIDALVRAAEMNGTSGRRHRIEHLESTDPADIGRLAAAGITASMQPVHADPEILPNWTAMLGAERAQLGFAWPLYLDDGGGSCSAPTHRRRRSNPCRTCTSPRPAAHRSRRGSSHIDPTGRSR